MTSTEIENKLQITEMKGDLKLLNQKNTYNRNKPFSAFAKRH